MRSFSTFFSSLALWAQTLDDLLQLWQPRDSQVAVLQDDPHLLVLVLFDHLPRFLTLALAQGNRDHDNSLEIVLELLDALHRVVSRSEDQDHGGVGEGVLKYFRKTEYFVLNEGLPQA
jgi:hypothetical protein